MLDAGLAAVGRDSFFPRRPLAIDSAALLRLGLTPTIVTLPLRCLPLGALLSLDVPLLSSQPVAFGIALARRPTIVAGVRAAPLTLHPGRDRSLFGFRLPVDPTRGVTAMIDPLGYPLALERAVDVPLPL